MDENFRDRPLLVVPFDGLGDQFAISSRLAISARTTAGNWPALCNCLRLRATAPSASSSRSIFFNPMRSAPVIEKARAISRLPILVGAVWLFAADEGENLCLRRQSCSFGRSAFAPGRPAFCRAGFLDHVLSSPSVRALWVLRFSSPRLFRGAGLARLAFGGLGFRGGASSSRARAALGVDQVDRVFERDRIRRQRRSSRSH